MKKLLIVFVILLTLFSAFLSSLVFAGRLSVGYIEGGGDDAPFGTKAFELANIPYKIIGKDDYKVETLLEFDVIAIGVVAYDKNQDLIANFRVLHEYVKRGGYIVTADYQQDATWKPEYLPNPITLTDEDLEEGAELEIVDHKIWRNPNKITKEHFVGWGAGDFVADMPSDVKSPWKPVLLANKRPIVNVSQAGAGVVVFSSLQTLQSLGRTGNKNVAQVLENLLFWRGPLSVDQSDKLATSWAKLKIGQE